MASSTKTIEVEKSSMPVSCPQKGTESWNLHPRVYIKISTSDGGNCPYCGNHFKFVE